MIELPQRCFIGRVNPRWFARVRPLFINYTGSETLTEMQVECVLSSSDIPFEKLRPDKEDLLFVDQNNEVIPHFIKEQNNSEIKLLLKFHTIRPGREIFWLYFGRPDFRGSDKFSTFFFYDDFEDGELGSQWTYADGCSSDDYYEESDGVGTLYVHTVSECTTHLYQADYNDTPVLEGNLPDTDFELIVVYYNWNPPAGSSPYHEIGIDFIQDGDDFVGHILGHSSWEDKYTRTRFKVDAGSSSRTETARHSPDTRTYRYIKVIRTGDTYHFYYSTNGENWVDEGSETKSGLTKFALSVYVSSGSYSGSFSEIRIRKIPDVNPIIEI